MSTHHQKALSSENIARRLGFAADGRIASHTETMPAAIWQFSPTTVYELDGPANVTDVISMPVAGHCHHRYFADGRPRWSRVHPTFHANVVAAGEQPRGVRRQAV
jgi:AraC family transcriptional regulator